MSIRSSVELQLPDEAATLALGRALGARLQPGDRLALQGELGSGKTTLVRGLGLGLQLDDPAAVQSPTYLLVIEHPGPRPLLHMDAYLGDKLRRFLADGGLDYLDQRGAIAAIEWADRIPDLLPPDALWVELLPAPDGGRLARLTAPAGRYPWLAELAAVPGG
jgi:tRNA threonylcarbamoyladenosine biosynthesis protein TsaE